MRRPIPSLHPLALALSAALAGPVGAQQTYYGTDGQPGANGTAPGQAGSAGTAAPAIAVTDPGPGGIAVFGGQGGRGGDGAPGTASVRGGDAGAGGRGGNASGTSSGVYAYGGAGGSAGRPGTGPAGTGRGARGGDGGNASGRSAYVAAQGGSGGWAYGAGGQAGNGGSATGTAVATPDSSGRTAAFVGAAGGDGGQARDGAAPGLGGSVSLVNRVSGRTTGDLELTQMAAGGNGGSTDTGLGGRGGTARSRLDLTDTQVRTVVLRAGAGGGTAGDSAVGLAAPVAAGARAVVNAHTSGNLDIQASAAAGKGTPGRRAGAVTRVNARADGASSVGVYATAQGSAGASAPGAGAGDGGRGRIKVVAQSLSGSVRAVADLRGGQGGDSTTGRAGNGGAAVLRNAVQASSRGEVLVTQTAAGGAGGYSDGGGAGGNGGHAAIQVTEKGQAAVSHYGLAAYGGAGGRGSRVGAGGNARIQANVEQTGSAGLSAYAEGGSGSRAGTASVDSTVTARGNGSSTVDITARGRAPTVRGAGYSDQGDVSVSARAAAVEGEAVSLNNVVSGRTTGVLNLAQSAEGGAGAGGSGGDARSVLTLTDHAARSVWLSGSAMAGQPDLTSQGRPMGSSGQAFSRVELRSTVQGASLQADSQAWGKHADSGPQASALVQGTGDSRATATANWNALARAEGSGTVSATAASTARGATAQAIARSLDSTGEVTAYAEHNAGGSALAQAAGRGADQVHATAMRWNDGHGDASANTDGVHGVAAHARVMSDGTSQMSGTQEARVAVGGPLANLHGVNEQSFAVALPDSATVAGRFGMDATVNESLAGLTPLLLGTMAEGDYLSRTLTSTWNAGLNFTAAHSGHLTLGLDDTYANPNLWGSFDFTVSANGQVLLTRHFASGAEAADFFNDRVFDLGPVDAGAQDVEFTAQRAQGDSGMFRFSYVLAASGDMLAVPEPSLALMWLCGLAVLAVPAGLRRRSCRTSTASVKR